MIDLNERQYQYYKEFLDHIDSALIKYGTATGLPIQLWHINMDLSKNVDDLGITESMKHFVYDLYHFVPTVFASPFTYSIGYDQTKTGMSNTASGTLSIYLPIEPIPGDIFRYYPYDNAIDRTELFRITNVRYMRTTKFHSSLYQIDFESAPILLSTMEHVRINTIQCWDDALSRFLSEEECRAKMEFDEKKEELFACIKQFYSRGFFGACVTDEKACQNVVTPPIILNSGIYRLKKFLGAEIELPPQYSIGVIDIPLKYFDQFIVEENIIDEKYQNYIDTFYCKRYKFPIGEIPENEEKQFYNLKVTDDEEIPKWVRDAAGCLSQLIDCFLDLYRLVRPLLNEEQLQDVSCENRCCNNSVDIRDDDCFLDYLNESYFWDFYGSDAQNSTTVKPGNPHSIKLPKVISFQDGIVW